jgi:hypothetical protein
MTAKFLPGTYIVSARCPFCEAVTTFDPRQSVAITSFHSIEGRQFNRVMFHLCQCSGCQRGALSIASDAGSAVGAHLDDFYPFAIDESPLPLSVPVDISTEFREAEKCQGIGLNRAASALYRSVLEKTLKANGYTKGNDPSLKDLQKRIDAAAADGVITQARQKKAHDDIRALGNDVLHDDWRSVTNEEVEDAHRYMQRILEDLYDDRATVEDILIARKRLQAPTTAAGTSTTTS